MPSFAALALIVSLGSSTASVPARAHVLFDGPVNPESVTLFESQLEAAAEHGASVVVVEFNTPGGSVGAGIEMAKAIERSPLPVICVVDGMAASMGLYILQSCDQRVMTSRSLLMGHEPASGIQGQPDDVSGLADLLHKLSHAMAFHVTHRMKVSVAEYEALIAHGRMWWLTADEALAVGAIDGIVVSVRSLE